jgi:hypothetical protein
MRFATATRVEWVLLVSIATLAITGCSGEEQLRPPVSDATADGAIADGALDGLADAPRVADSGPVSDTYVSATLGPHLDSMNNNLCSNANPQSALKIGMAAAAPVPVASGDTFQGAAISVSCAVTGGFMVNLQASKQGSGTMLILGNVDATSGGSGILAHLVSNGLSYTESDCTIAYTYLGGPVPTTPVAAGRIWAHLKCPSMTNGQQRLLGNGMYVAETCDGEADFLFENCQQ